jgi:formylmethanofuran dehydrogenase subunit E
MTTLRSHKGKIGLEDYFEAVEVFHGHLAPGLVLGGFMVDWALEAMEASELLDAVVETRKCLPDAVQILTKCSVGNGWLRILDWGKLALTLYDKDSLEGARVHLDALRLGPYPRVRAWAMKEKPKAENPMEPLIDEMVRAGRQVLTFEKVILESVPELSPPYGQPKICVQCGEAFRSGAGETCHGCAIPFLSVEQEAVRG